MSKLLLDSEPLVIIPELAAIIGLHESIVIQQIHYWLKINEKAKKNFHEGRYWTYNSYTEWQKQFPFWCTKTIQRIIAKLEEKEYIISNNFNSKSFDQTKWYTINYDHLDKVSKRIGQNVQIDKIGVRQTVQMDRTKCPDELDKMNKAIPKITTEITTEISVSKSDRQTELQNIIDQCELEVFGERIKETFEGIITQMYFAPEIKVSGSIIPQTIIRKQLYKLNAIVIQGVLDKLENAPEHITNSTKYIGAVLFNELHERYSDTFM